jgi:hypothetical protein
MLGLVCAVAFVEVSTESRLDVVFPNVAEPGLHVSDVCIGDHAVLTICAVPSINSIATVLTCWPRYNPETGFEVGAFCRLSIESRNVLPGSCRANRVVPSTYNVRHA